MIARRRLAAGLIALAAGLLGLAALILSRATPAAPAAVAHWRPLLATNTPEDLSGPLGNGKVVVQAGGGLSLWGPGGRLQPFAPSYSTPLGSESYMDISSGRRLPYANCSFGKGATYALEPAANTVMKVTRRGGASTFATLPAGFLSGIAFDNVGRFGYRLLVTDRSGDGSIALYGLDCRGRARLFGRGLPKVEGGLVVAPVGFGRFGGRLIAADELSGNIYAFSPQGTSQLVAASGLPAGGDTGVEALGFFPPAAASFPSAYVASAHGKSLGHGTNSILSLSPNDIRKADMRPGDLLAASETAATSVRVRCARSCSVRKVADGPAAAHVEGHIVFVTPSG